MLRLILIIIAIPLLLILAVAILAPLLLDKEKILDLAATELHKRTGAVLEVQGEVGLTIFPTLGISLGQAAVTMPEEQQLSLTARALDIGVQLMPLLSKQVEIDTIALDGLVVQTRSAPEQPAVDTSKMSDAELDAFYAKRREDMEQAGQAAGAQEALALPLALKIRQLSITDSRLQSTDADSGEVTTVELVQLKSSGLNLDGKPIPLQLELRIPGEQPLQLTLDGDISVSQGGQTVGLAGVTATVAGATPQPVRLTLNGEVDVPRQIADLKLALDLGETRGDGTLRYASFESPQVDTRMHLNLLDPALLVLAGPEAAAEAGDTPDSGGASGDEPLPLDAIRAIDTRANLNIDRAVIDAHTVENLKVNLRADDGVIRVNSLTGTLHGGKLDMKANFNGKHNIARLMTEGSLKAMDIPTALKAVESEPVLDGSADMNWKLSSKGSTVNELVANLNGPIKLVANDAVLKEMGVEQMLCETVALVNQETLSASFPADSAFKALSADVKLVKGRAQLKPLRAQLDQVNLTGSGYFDLVSHSFDTTFKARLSPGLKELDPACRVNERITAIDWPVNCKGETSGEPGDWCSVDSAEIIEDLATQEVERKVKKEVERKLGKEAGDLFDNLLNR